MKGSSGILEIGILEPLFKNGFFVTDGLPVSPVNVLLSWGVCVIEVFGILEFIWRSCRTDIGDASPSLVINLDI